MLTDRGEGAQGYGATVYVRSSRRAAHGAAHFSITGATAFRMRCAPSAWWLPPPCRL